MTKSICARWRLAVFLCLPGCGVLSCNVSSAAAPPCIRRGILFVVDGAGGFEEASRSIRQTAAEENLPFEVRSVDWTHGFCRVFSDQVHKEHLQREGCKFAELVLQCRHESPNTPIVLMGHSAGCGVVLLAAENLPPNTVERIVLLAPAVSNKYDLRRALRSSCQGIDVFLSHRDLGCLGVGTLLAGTTDRCRLTGAAGRTGFHPILCGCDDELLYTKLHQYPWDPSLRWTGHKGGHYGSYQPMFFRLFVFPLLTSSLSCREAKR
jgi:pimeloyl-ACP methyl ester carboxylesterase